MKTNCRFAGLIVLLTCSLWLPLGWGDVTYLSTFNRSIVAENNTRLDRHIGVPFTTDAQVGGYELGDVVLNMRETTAGTLNAQLFEGDGTGLPTGSSLGSFTVPSIGGSNQDATFSPIGAINLEANQEYVFALMPDSGRWEINLVIRLPVLIDRVGGVGIYAQPMPIQTRPHRILGHTAH